MLSLGEEWISFTSSLDCIIIIDNQAGKGESNLIWIYNPQRKQRLYFNRLVVSWWSRDTVGKGFAYII